MEVLVLTFLRIPGDPLFEFLKTNGPQRSRMCGLYPAKFTKAKNFGEYKMTRILVRTIQYVSVGTRQMRYHQRSFTILMFLVFLSVAEKKSEQEK